MQDEHDEHESLLTEEKILSDPSHVKTIAASAAVMTKDERVLIPSSSLSLFCFGAACLCVGILLGSLGMFVKLSKTFRDGIVQHSPLTNDQSTSSSAPTTWNSFHSNATPWYENVTDSITTNEMNQNITNVTTISNSSIYLDHQSTANTTAELKASSNVEDPFPNGIDDEDSRDDSDDLPQVWNGNLQFRRVCASVYEATLCLTIRYPFQVPSQDPTVTFPKPVDARFYNLSRVIFVDGPVLEQTAMCQPSNGTGSFQSMSDRVYACLEQVARDQDVNNDAVVAVFTRKKAESTNEDFYGTQLQEQRRRVEDYFRGHIMLVIGASPAPAVASGLKGLFGKCTSSKGNIYCNLESKGGGSSKDSKNENRSRKMRRRRSQESSTPSYLNQVWIRVLAYYPRDHWGTHIVNWTSPFLDALRGDSLLTAGLLSDNDSPLTTSKDRLRPLSIIVEFPIAHSQSETMIIENIDQVRYNQMEFTHKIMNLTTSQPAQQELAGLGLKLANIIAFDGLPQHFPTKTGGYIKKIGDASTTEQLIGTTCMGPLPPNSPLRRVNKWERRAFEHYGLEMNKFYASTWEFANQFWWEEQMWNGKGGALDCTHTRTFKWGAGMTTVHKYFLQAIVDGYYESQGQRRSRK